MAEHLDILSFPNSIYPGCRTLKDCGFTHFENADGGVRSIDLVRHWVFGVKIIEDNGGIKVLCIQDGTSIGGDAFSQSSIEVKLGAMAFSTAPAERRKATSAFRTPSNDSARGRNGKAC